MESLFRTYSNLIFYRFGICAGKISFEKRADEQIEAFKRKIISGSQKNL